MPWLPAVHTPEDDRLYFRRKIATEAQVTLIEENDCVIAYLATRRGWIDDLYVAPNRWRSGHGRRLLTFAQAMQDALQLWTFEQNTAAIAFYTAHGFEVVERTDGSGNEEGHPDLRMVWLATYEPLA